jgi:hypothetical protein
VQAGVFPVARDTALARFTAAAGPTRLVLEAADEHTEGEMNETITLLLLTALRIVLPVILLMGIGTYFERRRSPGNVRDGHERSRSH